MKTASVRQRIVDTASRLFYDQGYQATGINQIIEEAEIAKSSLYLHFKSKDELLAEYLRLAHQEWFAGLETATAHTLDPQQKLLLLFDYSKKRAVARHFKGCTFMRLAYEMPNLEEPFAGIIRQYKEAVKTFIKNQVARLRKKMTDAQVQELTDIIYTLHEGCGMEAYLQRSAAPIDHTRKIAAKLIQ